MPSVVASASQLEHQHSNMVEKCEDFDLWNPTWPPQMTEEEAADLIAVTRERIDRFGLCLWKCRRLGSAVICVVSTRTARDPRGWPVYSLDELSMLAETDDWTQRMILEAKRIAGAIVTKVIWKGGND